MPTGTVVLERDAELATFLDAADAAAGGSGSVVLVSGEAGIGKSSLVAAVRRALPSGARVLVGRCDDLTTPRVLGALRDLAGEVGADLARALRAPGERDALFAAVHDELDWAGHATVLVVEDVHWADEATLDLLRWLGRRVDALPALLVLTCRDDEPGEPGNPHPVRRLLAAAAAWPSVHRLALRPLSEAAVAVLSARTAADPAAVVALTGGNPFLVREVLASPGGVPAGVADLVHARLHRLDPASRDAVERLSVLSAAPERALVDALVPGGLPALAVAEQHGLLIVTPRQVTFHHELVRRAVLDGLTGARRTSLNGAALVALEALSGVDPARLVHHAREAGDVAAVLRHGPEAARAASTGRAHRQAAEHLHTVLAHRQHLAPDVLVALLEASAVECYTVGDRGRSALADQREAVALRRRRPDQVALGSALRWLSRISWWVGDRPGAERAAAEAVEVLATAGDRRELALAVSNTAQVAMLGERLTEAIEHAGLAVTLAHEIGDPAVLSHALNNLGTARWARGDPAGRGLLEESRDLALAHGLAEHASRACCNLVWQLLVQLRPRDAAEELVRGIEVAEGAEQVAFWRYLHVERAMVAMAQARWADARTDAAVGLDATSPIRCSALFVLGRVALRTGGEARALVEECWELGQELAEPQRTAPAAALACEAAWLAGDLARVREIAAPVHAETVRLGVPVWGVELEHWLRLAGAPVDPSEGTGVRRASAPLGGRHPYAASARGDWVGAAAAWESAGYPYEAAAALTCVERSTPGRTGSVLAGLADLDALGATALADRVRAELRTAGVPGVPRGPSARTRAQVAGLTGRQLEVLELLAQGCTNAAIADRLVLSVRTVDHHVADVLHKLGASSRTEAPVLAARRGWAPRSTD